MVVVVAPVVLSSSTCPTYTVVVGQFGAFCAERNLRGEGNSDRWRCCGIDYLRTRFAHIAHAVLIDSTTKIANATSVAPTTIKAELSG